jgi:hypothetical protein
LDTRATPSSRAPHSYSGAEAVPPIRRWQQRTTQGRLGEQADRGRVLLPSDTKLAPGSKPSGKSARTVARLAPGRAPGVVAPAAASVNSPLGQSPEGESGRSTLRGFRETDAGTLAGRRGEALARAPARIRRLFRPRAICGKGVRLAARRLLDRRPRRARDLGRARSALALSVRRTELSSLVVGFGAVTAILWELGEYFAFIRNSPELATAYTDTLGDLSLGLSGSTLAAAIAVAALGKPRIPEADLSSSAPTIGE